MGHVDGYSERPRRALERLVAALEPLGEEVVALVVYGSLAKGTHRGAESDVNLAVVVRAATPATLAAIAGPLRAARREARVEPFVIERDEIPRLADVFPLKLADIRDARHAIAGVDPFGAITIEREHMRLRTEQELRNHLLRLRRHAVLAGDDPGDLTRALYASVVSIGIELGALLTLAGRAMPPGAETRAIVRAASEAFDLELTTLEQLCDLHDGASLADARATFDGLLRVLRRAVSIADRDEASE